MSIAASGAKSETEAQLLALLGIDDAKELSEQCGNLYRVLYRDNKIGKLKIANSIWMDDDMNGEPIIFKDDFVKRLAENFYASSHSVDFANEETGKIMVDWISTNTILNLLNGFYLMEGQQKRKNNMKKQFVNIIKKSLAVLVASIILIFFDIPIIDPILSILITIYIMYNVMKNLKEIFHVLLQGVPSGFKIDDLEDELEKIDGILSVHHTHIWSLEGEKNMLSTHVVTNNNAQMNEVIRIKKEARHIMEEKGIEHVTIKLEFEDEDCQNTDCSRVEKHLY